MAEYTDKYDLIRFLCHLKQPRKLLIDGFTFIAIDDVIKVVAERPTADVVEREKIDKAIDEVYKMRKDVLYANGCYEPDDVLDIIDQITKLFEEI